MTNSRSTILFSSVATAASAGPTQVIIKIRCQKSQQSTDHTPQMVIYKVNVPKKSRRS